MRTISIGAQGFEDLRTNRDFYVDKTGFVRDWWFERDVVTLICRPRRFGKTLNLDTVRCFLSTEFAGRGEELFGGLDAWSGGSPDQLEAMRALQGSMPVVFMSFADVKDTDFDGMVASVCGVVADAYNAHGYLYDWDGASALDRSRLSRIGDDMDTKTCTRAIKHLCSALRRYWGVKPVVLLDEYDTPMQEAWAGGYWNEACAFIRSLMNSTFKTNPDMSRGLITGVTRVSRESIFSDLNNLEVITTSSTKYRTAFGFTQGEVDEALAEYGLDGLARSVRDWYDGFTFGGKGHIYNPWSVTKFLEARGTFAAYWANTSGNEIVSTVLRRGDNDMKGDFERLMNGDTIHKVIDEQVVFSELSTRPNAVWALLLAAGYLTSPDAVPQNVEETPRALALTNHEIELTFDRMVEGWFTIAGNRYGRFADALLSGDAEAATDYLRDVTSSCMSYFDGAGQPAEREPERFYHGLVLGLLAHLRGRWAVESNRESGYGRYDVALVPIDGHTGSDPAVIMEFKVFDARREKTLKDTVAYARRQVESKRYASGLVERGIAPERIRTYGIAFRGKDALVG